MLQFIVENKLVMGQLCDDEGNNMAHGLPKVTTLTKLKNQNYADVYHREAYKSIKDYWKH